MSKFDKKKLFKELSERYKDKDEEYLKKLKKYDKVVDRAKVIVNLLYGKSATNTTKSEQIRMLVDEYYSYHGSILKSFRNYKTKTPEENFERAKQIRVKDRFKNFLDLFGEQTYTFKGNERNLNEWMKEYLKGNITSKDLYFIYQWWQAINSDFMNEFYKNLEMNQIFSEQTKSGNIY